MIATKGDRMGERRRSLQNAMQNAMLQNLWTPMSNVVLLWGARFAAVVRDC